MSKVYKVVARYSDYCPSWITSVKKGVQWKKKIYINEEKFNKHGIELVERWRKLGFDVTSYSSKDGKTWDKI